MTPKGDAIFKEKLTGGLKNDKGIWLVFMGAPAGLKMYTLLGLFCPKYINF